jgi:hypothetical protein
MFITLTIGGGILGYVIFLMFPREILAQVKVWLLFFVLSIVWVRYFYNWWGSFLCSRLLVEYSKGYEH